MCKGFLPPQLCKMILRASDLRRFTDYRLNLHFRDRKREKLFLQSKEQSTTTLVLIVYTLVSLYNPIKLCFLARAGLDGAWLQGRFILTCIFTAVAIPGFIVTLLRRRAGVFGQYWETFLVSQVTLCTIVNILEYHPMLDSCAAHTDCLWLRPLMMAIPLFQHAICLPVVARAGPLWLSLLITAALAIWGLADSLKPLISNASQSGFDTILVILWVSPIMIGQQLYLGYIQERSLREYHLQEEEKELIASKTELCLAQDSKMTRALLRLAMARFEAVLCLTGSFQVASATEQADELLGTEVVGIDFPSLFELEDAHELKERLQALADEPVREPFEDPFKAGLKAEPQDSPHLGTTTLMCKLNFDGGVWLRIVASPVESSQEAAADGQQYVLGIERIAPVAVMPVMPDVATSSSTVSIPKIKKSRSGRVTGKGTPARSPRTSPLGLGHTQESHTSGSGIWDTDSECRTVSDAEPEKNGMDSVRSPTRRSVSPRMASLRVASAIAEIKKRNARRPECSAIVQRDHQEGAEDFSHLSTNDGDPELLPTILCL